MLKHQCFQLYTLQQNSTPMYSNKYIATTTTMLNLQCIKKNIVTMLNNDVSTISTLNWLKIHDVKMINHDNKH